MKKHIIVCDHIHEEGLKILRTQADIDLEDLASLPKSELLPRLHKADVLITRSSTSVTESLLEAACKDSKLKAIVRAGVGVDNVDMDACSSRGVVVMNVPTANTIAAVELTMAHLLSAVRRLPDAHSQLKQRIWCREDWYGVELRGKKLGVIGFGNIGSRVATRAKAFDMEVLAYDPYVNPSKALDLGIGYTTDFDEILACDFITIHTPKNKQTTNMITSKEIAKMKDGVILINCARGGLYNEDDLYEALKSKKVAWAGIDVFSKEPALDNKLLELDSVYVTPHIGANTLESQERIAIEAANAAISAARGLAFPNALNLPLKSEDLLESIPSYLELSQKLGYFSAQAIRGALSSLSLQVYGAELEEYQEALLTLAAVGALKPALDDKINHVNASFVAKQRGVSTHVSFKQSAGAYKNLLTLTLSSDKESVSVSGTVYEGHIIRFNNINGFSMDLEPRGHMILVRNTDVPGVIGSLGHTIARHSVNIADFRLGRSSEPHARDALALILVDNEVSEELLRELRSIKECLSVRAVSF